MLDRSLVTLHLIHHERVSVEQLEHRQDGLVSELEEQDLAINLVERDEILTAEYGQVKTRGALTL